MHTVTGGKAGKKETTTKTKKRLVGNIKMDLREIGWGVWAGSIWLR
jgi:hypothetical protein